MIPVLHLRDPPAPPAESLMRFWLIVIGIYFWEYITTLHYEWDVIRGRQRYRWTIWVYSLARFATFMLLIVHLISFNFASPSNCQAIMTSSWAFGFLALTSGSLLIVLRVFALWNRNKVILGIATAAWVVNLVFLLVAVVQIRTEWSPVTNACKFINLEACKPSVCTLLAADIALLLIMLVGLLRLRRGGGGSFGLGRLLWKQGVIWLAIATAAELPQAVLMILDYNDTLNFMLLMPSLVTMTIAATRIYRALSNFVSISPPNTVNDLESGNTSRRRSSHLVSTRKDAPVVHISSNRLEVSAHTAYEEYPMSQLADKPQDHSLKDNAGDREGEK